MKSLLSFIGCLLCLAANPVLANKKENFSEYYKQDCSFVVGQPADGNDWCNRGNADGKSPNVVIIGDSYGNSFTTILEEVALQKNSKLIYEQYGHGQCPGILDYGPKKWCANFSQEVFNKIKNTPSINTVIMAIHWPYYLASSWRWNESNLAYSQEETSKALEKTIIAYRKIGKNVVFVYASPGIANPKVCAERRIRISNALDQCKVTKVAAMDGQYYRPYLDPMLKRLNVAIFDPMVYLCNATECKVRDGNKIFYASQAHLSGFGGQYLARKAAPELKQLLNY